MPEKVCAIVGFGSGVGLSVAKVFAQQGYALALLARNPEKLAANAQELQGNHFQTQIRTFVANAGDATSLSQALTQIQTEWGEPEVLIYNAAAFSSAKPSVLNPEQLVADFRTNVVGALVAVQQVLPGMKAKARGTILFTGGGLAFQPWADAASLAIGKAGIRNLTFSLAQELKGTGIRVGTVTICGIVQPGTHFDPDAIAQSYLTLHQQSLDNFDPEIVFK